jgi:hypothetical protein
MKIEININIYLVKYTSAKTLLMKVVDLNVRNILHHVHTKLSLCLTKHPTMKVYWGGGTALHMLDLGTTRRWVVNFMPWLFYSRGNSPQYQLDRRMGGAQIFFL